MNPQGYVQPPPVPRMMDYPGTIGVSFLILFTTIMVFIAGKFDPSGGVLALSMLVVLAFVGVVIFCLFFTVPNDEITSSVVGGLTAAFGAVIAFWLGRHIPPKQ